MGKIKERIRHRFIQSGPGRQLTLLRTNIILLVALLIMIFLMPVIPFEVRIITRILLILVAISGLFAAEFSRYTFRILFVFATGLISVIVLGVFFEQSDLLRNLSFSLSTLFYILITIALVTHVAGSKEVKSSTLLCAVNSYLLIGLSLSMIFVLLELIIPGSFNIPDADENEFSTFLYYGFVTLTTLGYGDILPLTPLARSVASFTALFGQLYLVTIMAFLIGKYLNTKKQDS